MTKERAALLWASASAVFLLFTFSGVGVVMFIAASACAVISLSIKKSKLGKIMLIACGAVLLVVGLFFGWLLLAMQSSAKRAEVDVVEQSRLCDTIPYITERPEITFAGFGFPGDDVDTLRFRLLRNGRLIQDTVVCSSITYTSDNDAHRSVAIPYASFLKTDTVVITTKGGLYFYLWGYHHHAHLHYGMFGYVGSSDCRFSDECMVNNGQYDGVISKYWGWTDPEKSKHVHRITVGSEEFEAFEKKSAITYDEALRIFQENKQNDRNASTITLFCEDGPQNYYVFAEEMSNGKQHVVKVNAQTGECLRFTSYPYNS